MSSIREMQVRGEGEARRRGILSQPSIIPILFLLLVLVTPSLCKGAAIDDAIRQQQQLQQQEEQRRLELERKHREALDQPPAGKESPQQEPAEKQGRESCFEVRVITYSGMTLLEPKEIDPVTEKYRGRCLTFTDINNLVRDVTNLYIAKGYVTTRVVIPQQDLSNGTLHLQVIEGKVEGIEFQDGQGTPRELKGAMPGLTGGPLNLRDIEQGLDQLNRLPSNNASMKLLPGSTPGATKVEVENNRSKTWRISAGMDNSGQDSTGRNQYLFSLAKDNLIGCNDLLSLYLNGDAKGLFSDKRQRSSTWNLFYSVPYGYWTFSGSASYYEYRTEISGSGTTYSSAGDTTTTSLTVDRVLFRDQDSKTSLGFGLTVRDTQNYFAGDKLNATSQVLSALSVSLAHYTRLLGGMASAQAGFSQGVPILGAKRDRTPSLDTPRSQFSKATFSASYYRPFNLGNTRFSWSTRASGQWAPHTLYSAERISIGSRYTVRGFHEDSLSGDIGAYMRNELALSAPVSADSTSFRRDWVGDLQFYAGYDAGVIRRDPKEAEEQGSLQGAVIGVRTSGARLVMDMAVAHPLAAPSFLQTDDLEFYTSLQFSF